MVVPMRLAKRTWVGVLMGRFSDGWVALIEPPVGWVVILDFGPVR